jgi:hypothetical protein
MTVARIQYLGIKWTSDCHYWEAGNELYLLHLLPGVAHEIFLGDHNLRSPR